MNNEKSMLEIKEGFIKTHFDLYKRREVCITLVKDIVNDYLILLLFMISLMLS